MIPKSEYEKRERQQRELEAMRLAVAAYTGPVTKCPAGRTTDPHAVRPFRGRTRRARFRNAADDQKGTTRSLPDGQSGI
jgi:hypothetical protein